MYFLSPHQWCMYHALVELGLGDRRLGLRRLRRLRGRRRDVGAADGAGVVLQVGTDC